MLLFTYPQTVISNPDKINQEVYLIFPLKMLSIVITIIKKT